MRTVPACAARSGEQPTPKKMVVRMPSITIADRLVEHHCGSAALISSVVVPQRPDEVPVCRALLRQSVHDRILAGCGAVSANRLGRTACGLVQRRGLIEAFGLGRWQDFHAGTDRHQHLRRDPRGDGEGRATNLTGIRVVRRAGVCRGIVRLTVT